MYLVPYSYHCLIYSYPLILVCYYLLILLLFYVLPLCNIYVLYLPFFSFIHFCILYGILDWLGLPCFLWWLFVDMGLYYMKVYNWECVVILIILCLFRVYWFQDFNDTYNNLFLLMSMFLEVMLYEFRRYKFGFRNFTKSSQGDLAYFIGKRALHGWGFLVLGSSISSSNTFAILFPDWSSSNS